MDVLGKMFGNAARVRLMRLFLFNSELSLSTAEVAKRSRTVAAAAARELVILKAIGLVEDKKTSGKQKTWRLDPTFPYLSPMRLILRNDLLGRRKEIARLFNHCGKVNLLVIAGVFLEDDDSRADLLLVGDRLKKTIIERTIKGLEAEIGRELRYAVLSTEDYQYRLNASDKFVRDILDYAHETLIDKINV
jgi:hypothetical protein